MSHPKLNMRITDEWVLAQAAREPESGITSVGGLAARMEAAQPKPADPSRLSLAKFVELSRRRLGWTVEKLAEQADVDLAELVAIEKAEAVSVEPRTVFQLARKLDVKPEPLMQLAGLIEVKDSRVDEAALRFAARSEPMAKLSREEEEALKWFIRELTKA